MEKFSVAWKEAENKQHGGWAQKHGDVWKWHYIANDTEYFRGSYLTKKEAEEANA